ncbi:syndecan-2-A-like [Trichomycterus rosablanca]|uniref:syndecan-2-A-like n=1 Tax=Trichomycterus rosablanca TaxID=2290929 RepID=UPI002F34EF5E
MRGSWMVLTLSAFCLLGGTVVVTAQPASADDLYLEEQQSGDFLDDNEDDDGFSSGSGSGFSNTDDEDMLRLSKENVKPTQQSTQMSSPGLDESVLDPTVLVLDPTVEADPETEVPEVQTDKPQVRVIATSTSSFPDEVEESDKQDEVKSENLFQRTEVLAAVIAGGVIGFLFAIFLILLLVYRMRKKDEGSYDLGERKLPSTAYQKAPSKEFYA